MFVLILKLLLLRHFSGKIIINNFSATEGKAGADTMSELECDH